MFKKLLVLLMAILLCSCSPKNEVKEYIDPVKDIFIFGELDPDTKVAIKKANNGNEYKNSQFKLLNNDIYVEELVDINSNSFKLVDYDKVILQILSVECEHCIKQLDNIDSLDMPEDVELILFFGKGNKEEILSLYDDLGLTLPNVKIVCSDDQLKEYCTSQLGLISYPTTLSFNKGKISFNTFDIITSDNVDDYIDISFINPIYDSAKQYIDLYRDSEDVKNDLSKENLEKINGIDNDTYSLELTCSIMSTKLDFDIISNNRSNIYVNEIEDFSKYKDSELVLLYTYLKDVSYTKEVEFINELIDANKKINYIVVLIEGLDSSSKAYMNMDVKFNAPAVSVLGYKPDDFFKFGLTGYPTAVFVNKSTFTGAYSNIDSVDNFIKATDMFLGKHCIAYKENN